MLVFILFKPVDLGEHNWMVNAAGFLLSLLGELIRVCAVGYSFEGTSGRESYLRADDLNTTGIYSIVRNPLYIGNFFMFTGIVAVFANVYAVVVLAVFLVTQYYFIILSEENFLSGTHGQAYQDFCARTRRITPSFKHYRKNRNPFSLKKVVFKEKDSIFNMLVMFLLVLLYKEKVFYGSIRHGLVFIITGSVLVLLYIVVKIIKNRTRV
jgi:protein-S-isoprenylcysteine O-methyltransferase Ste14